MRTLSAILITALAVVLALPVVASAQGAAPLGCVVPYAGDDAAEVATSQMRAGAGEGLDTISSIGLQAVPGARLIATDAVVYVNACAETVELAIVADSIGGDWSHLAAQVHVSTGAAPTAIPTADLPGDQGEWHDEVLHVEAGTEAGLVDASTGIVRLAPGAEVQVAFVIDAAAGHDGNVTFRWAAHASRLG